MIFKPKWEFVISGSGGQGIILAGALLVEGANYDDRLNVSQTQNYGAQQRGGFSQSNIIVSREPIFFPVVTQPDITIILAQEAWQRNKDLLSHGLVLYDQDEVKPSSPPKENVLASPLSLTARQMGNPQALNILVVGLITGYTQVIPEVYVEMAIKNQFREETLKSNLEVFQHGISLGRQLGHSLEAPF